MKSASEFLKVQPVQDRNDNYNYWENDELYTYSDMMSFAQAYASYRIEQIVKHLKEKAEHNKEMRKKHENAGNWVMSGQYLNKEIVYEMAHDIVKDQI